jgi:tetratricopeptide (TPR) repeat protein
MDDRLRELITLGKEHYRRGDFEKAIPLLEEITQQNLPFADVYNMLGIMYHHDGDFSRAQISFQKALSINSAYTEASLNLAVLYNDIGKYDEAKQVYNRALKESRRENSDMDPFVKGKIANMYAEIGDAFRSAGFLPKAVDEYRRALELRPSYIDIRAKLGSTLRDMGELDEAVRELKLALQENEEYAPALNLLGVCHYMLDEIDKAREYWKDVLSIDPKNAVATMYVTMIDSDTSES